MLNKISEIIKSLHNLESLMQPYEEKYNIKSQDFYELAQAGKLEEDADFVKWMGYYELWLDNMKEYRQLFWSVPHPVLYSVVESASVPA
ncbi:MAG: hypothetical protein H8D78_02880 [Chloroflexi bacterium]|nr:hypothetical protein [Chloroflexota bacterium]